MFAFRTARAFAHSISISVGGAGGSEDSDCVDSSGLSPSFEGMSSVSSSAGSVSLPCPFDLSGCGRVGRYPSADLYAARASSHLRARKWTLPSCFSSSALLRQVYRALMSTPERHPGQTVAGELTHSDVEWVVCTVRC